MSVSLAPAATGKKNGCKWVNADLKHGVGSDDEEVFFLLPAQGVVEQWEAIERGGAKFRGHLLVQRRTHGVHRGAGGEDDLIEHLAVDLHLPSVKTRGAPVDVAVHLHLHRANAEAVAWGSKVAIEASAGWHKYLQQRQRRGPLDAVQLLQVDLGHGAAAHLLPNELLPLFHRAAEEVRTKPIVVPLVQPVLCDVVGSGLRRSEDVR